MTHFLQRSALILLATSALCASPALARTTHHAKKPAAAEADKAERASYTVKNGDTLAKIADKLDTTIEDLMTDNGLKKTSVLHPGQLLKGPVVAKPAAAKGASSKASAARPASAKTYTVVKGDTLFAISKKLQVSIDDLRSANGLSAKGQIHPGQELRLPGGEDAASETEKTPAKGDRSVAKNAKGGRGKSAPAEVADSASSDRGAGGHVVTVQASGETYKARKGDTLAKIADRLGADVSQVKRLNHVKGSSVRVGQVYHGPSFEEHIYTAAPGDTLATIAQRFGVSLPSLRAENELPKKAFSVKPGQKVYLPDGYRDRDAPVSERPSRSYPQPYQPGLPSRPIPYVPSGGTQAPSGVGNTSAPPTDTQITQLGKGRFQWPLKGQILSDFGAKPGGQNNAGVDIQADAGAPVRAAADGDVVYAGDQVPGFGNLVLIKHADGWSTAYAHLARIDVKMQQKISQGQQIGQAGATGGAAEPQLHFEIRYAPNPADRAAPVDPKLVLPK